MQTGKLPETRPDQRTACAFTLIELLIATTSSTIILLAVIGLLAAASNALSSGNRHNDILAEGRAASAQLTRDLQCSDTSPSNNPRLFQYLSETTQTASSPEINPCGGMPPLPFEHNRISGAIFSHLDWSETGTLARAAMNAASTDTGSLHPDFDTLAFATCSHRNRHGEPGLVLVSYYCTYTRDSPIAGDRASMKLFRHLRAHATDEASPGTYHQPAATYHDQARASSLLAMLTNSLRRQITIGIRDNRHLPYLLMPVDAFRDHHGKIHQAMHIWPANFFSLPEPPPHDTPDLKEPLHSTDLPRVSLHNSHLQADHPLACNVVRFKATPMHRDKQGRYLNASELNASLRINREHPTEWPVLVTPDIIDIELTIIGVETARKFRHRRDWLHWESDPSLAGLVQRESQSFRIRVAIGHAQT
jgi:type II secretory pathway pseudopilin PulG